MSGANHLAPGDSQSTGAAAPDAEDHRTAANMNATLSTQLMGVAVGVIAFVGAIDLFIFEKYTVGFWFYFWTLVSFAALTLGMIFGAMGIGKLTRRGFNGDWRRRHASFWFGLQAILSVLGIFAFILSWIAGISAAKVEDNAALRIKQLELEVAAMQKEIAALRGGRSASHTTQPAAGLTAGQKPGTP